VNERNWSNCKQSTAKRDLWFVALADRVRLRKVSKEILHEKIDGMQNPVSKPPQIASQRKIDLLAFLLTKEKDRSFKEVRRTKDTKTRKRSRIFINHQPSLRIRNQGNYRNGFQFLSLPSTSNSFLCLLETRPICTLLFLYKFYLPARGSAFPLANLHPQTKTPYNSHQ